MSNIYTYDVFISYAHEDKNYARLLNRKLQELDFLAWFDVSEINEGDPLEEKIREVLSNSAVCVLLIGAAGQSPWVSDSVWTAIHSRLESTHGTFRVVPIILPGAHTDSTGMLTALIRTQLISYRQRWNVIHFKESLDEEDALNQLVLKIRGVDLDDQANPLEMKFRESVRLRARNALNVNWNRLVFDLFSNSPEVFGDGDQACASNGVNAAEDWQDAWGIKQACLNPASKSKYSRHSVASLESGIDVKRTSPTFIQGSYRMQQSLRRRFLNYPVATDNVINLSAGQWRATTLSPYFNYVEMVATFLEFLTGDVKTQREVDSNINDAGVSQMTHPHKWETLKNIKTFKKSNPLLIEEAESRRPIDLLDLPQGICMPDGGINLIVMPATLAGITQQLCEHCAFINLGCLYDPQAVKWVVPDTEGAPWREASHISPECELLACGIINSNTLDFGESDSAINPDKLLEPDACSASYFYGMVDRLYFDQESINSNPQDTQIISHLWAEGKSPKEISLEVGGSVRTICRKLKAFQKALLISKEEDYPGPMAWHLDCPYCKTSTVDNAALSGDFSLADKGVGYVDYKDGVQSRGLTVPGLSWGGFLLYMMGLQNQELH